VCEGVPMMLTNATALVVAWVVFAGELAVLGWLVLRKPGRDR
jgi:hypothetical protein